MVGLERTIRKSDCAIRVYRFDDKFSTLREGHTKTAYLQRLVSDVEKQEQLGIVSRHDATEQWRARQLMTDAWPAGVASAAEAEMRLYRL